MQLENPQAAGIMPTAETLISAASRASSKAFPKNPASHVGIVIPLEFTRTLDDPPRRFLQVQETFELNGTPETMIVFCTDEFFVLMCTNLKWYMDGTFELSPPHFYQFFTMHIFQNFVGGDNPSNIKDRLLTAMYCFFTRKSMAFYNHFFQWIKRTAAERNIVSTYTSLEYLRKT
jgi:hypothetical protein